MITFLKNLDKRFLLLVTITLLIFSFAFTIAEKLKNPFYPVHQIYCMSKNNMSGWNFFIISDDGQQKKLEYNEEFYAVGPLDYDGQTVYAQRRMTEDIDNPLLYMDLSVYHAAVFLDNLLIHTSFPQVQNDIDKITFPSLNLTEYPGLQEVYITLPRDYVGKTLTVAFRQDLPDYPLYVQPIYTEFSNMSGFAAPHIANGMTSAYKTALFVMISFMLAILYLINVYQKKYSNPIWLFAITVLLMGIRILFSSPVMHNFMRLQLSVWIKVFVQDWYILPLFVFLFLQMKNTRKWFGFSLLIFLGCMGLTIADQFIPNFNVLYLSKLTNIVQFFMVFTLIVCIFWESYRKNKFYVLLKNACVGGFTFLAIAAVITKFLDIPWLYFIVLNVYSAFIDKFYFPLQIVWEPFLIGSCFLILIVQNINEIIEIRVRRKEQEFLYKLTTENYNHIKLYLEQCAIQRHEHKKHLLGISVLARKHQQEEISSYLHTLIEQDANIVPIVQTEHDLTNQLLNTRLREAFLKGFTIDTTNFFVPPNIGIPFSDWCSLIINILDNAINACEQLPKEVKPYITLESRVKNSYFMLKCHNPFYMSKQKAISSVNENCFEHGNGIPIMKKIVDKYDGKIDISSDENIFKLSAIFKMMPSSDLKINCE